MRLHPLLVLPLLSLGACRAVGISAIGSDTPTPTASQPTPSPTATPGAPALRIEVIDVGQGDSTLIQGPGGKTLLVDGGDEGADSRVIAALSANQITQLDYIVATHPHADHVGGLDEVMRAYAVTGGVFDNGEALTTVAYTNYQAAASASAGGRHTMALGQVLDLGGGATATCVAVNGSLDNGAAVTVTDPNDRSVALIVEWGDFRLFVGGDLGGGGNGAPDVETPLAAIVGDVDVLLVDHHGSDTSTNSAWVNALSPEVAIISDGDGNSYGHPDPTVLARLTGTDSTVHVPPPDLFLTERGAAPSGFNGSGNVVIVARQTTYSIGPKTYDASTH